MLYVCNVEEACADKGNAFSDKVSAYAASEGAVAVVVSAKIESEIAILPFDEQKDYLDAVGLEEPGLNRVIRAGYALLHLVTYFTVGPKEARAWTIEKGTKVFLSQWKSLSTDLTALNPDDHSSVSSLGGQVDPGEQGLIEKSPLYHIYQIGSEEIRHRLDKDNNRIQGLSGRSIQAIRASLDAGLVHESHRLSDGLVYLTISIAGGPYVGLLGTVVGVMITFAIIAKSGEVNVNSIAPGIASALLATVVGLVVAIPALFIYSYLNGRIKNSLALMQVFIDEFVAKMAEFYRPANETDYTGGGSH